MEGIRFLATKSKISDQWLFGYKYRIIEDELFSHVYQVWPKVEGLGAGSFYVELTKNTSLVEFLEQGIQAVSPYGPAHAFSSAGVKIVFSSFDGYNIRMPKSTFEGLVNAINPDPLSFDTLYGIQSMFETMGGLANGGIVMVHWKTPMTRFMWSIRQHEGSPQFDTRCLAILGHGYDNGMREFFYDRMENGNEDLTDTYMEYNSEETWKLLDCLEAFKQDVHSPLYLPFVLSVHAYHFCRYILADRVEFYLKFTHYSTRQPHRWIMDTQNEQMRILGRMFLCIRTTLDGIEELYNHLEDMANGLPPSAKSEKVLQSTNSILCAIQFQRKAMKSVREELSLGERRAQHAASGRQVALSGLDAKINIKTAYTNRDLATAAQRDSSAMKSIAVLTMVFLPGTFFATLFSMPSLGWDQSGYFGLYWVYTIPFTVLTFIIWVIFSQRRELRQWARARYPWLPLWCIRPPKMTWDRQLLDDGGAFADEELGHAKKRYHEFWKRRIETKKQMKARIDGWKPWNWKRKKADESRA